MSHHHGHHGDHGGHGGHQMHDDDHMMMPVPEAEAAAGEGGGHHMHTDVHIGHQGMMMYFHGGVTEVILFDFWRTDSTSGLVGSVLLCLIMGILYEALKFFRDGLYASHMKAKCAEAKSRSKAAIEQGGEDNNDEEQKTKVKQWIKTLETNMWSRIHLVQTLLHMVQIVLSYFLMLVFMTFNSWLCLSVVLGMGMGYFAFGWKKTVVLETDGDGCCH